MQHRILSEHFGRVKDKLLEYSKHFDIAKHGDIKGYGREALVREFLATHLPDQIEYLTGEIIDPFDGRSGQVDIILQAKSQPKVPLLANLHLAFAEAVVAVIEVKSTLTTQHLNAALDQFTVLKALRRNLRLKLNDSSVPLTSMPCVVFAFSGLGKEAVLNNINEYAKTNKLQLDECSPDMVVVLGGDYYICKNDGWQFPIIPGPGAYFRDWMGLPHENLVGLYNYLNNVIRAYVELGPTVNIASYFDKSALKKSGPE